MFCKECEALEETCCAASKARRETAITLAELVSRQSVQIDTLTAKLDDARRLLAELMARNAV